MKGKSDYFIVVFILATLFLSGCNFPGSVSDKTTIYPTDTALPIISEVVTSQMPGIDLTQTASAINQSIAETPIVEPSITPIPTEACVDHAELVEDVTVSDGTSFSPAEIFVKTWRLRNIGTCIWTEQYKIVFTGGSQMNGTTPIALSKVVPQGETIDISISFTSPNKYGEYKGEWQLQNEAGIIFGIGENAQSPFDVKINVIESVSGVDLGTPTWDDTFKNSNNWYLLRTPNTVWSHKKGHIIMKAISSGKKDEWGFATYPPVEDFYIEATFKMGEDCEGRDRYGLVIRANSSNSGYVFSFACEGSYRFYRWDGANYYALQEWKEDVHIVKGVEQTNQMGILAEDDTFKLYANGELLGEFDDDMFDAGRFGLVIGSAETSNLIVYVEDIALWEIDE